MPFFRKDFTVITSADLAKLLTTAAAENVRLEFKSEHSGQEQALMVLSASAHTFRGYLIVGALAFSSDTVLTSPVSSRYGYSVGLKIPRAPQILSTLRLRSSCKRLVATNSGSSEPIGLRPPKRARAKAKLSWVRS